MSKVISKVRCYNPSKSNTTSGNVNHLYYIARRNMTLKNENGIPTFGEIDNIDVENAKLKDIAREIAHKSNKKTNIYRGIISLKEEDALQLGYDKREEWKALMERKVYDIGKKLGVPPLNCQWVAVVHYKKNNPHIHYMLWDKEQKINDYFITSRKQNEIREMITKEIFEDEFQKYYNIQDEIKSNFRDKELALSLKAFDFKNCVGKIAYINLSEKTINEMQKLFKNIKSNIPKEGRITYSYMPENVKKDIDKFMKLFIENNIDFKNEYEKYIETAGKIGKMYGEKSEKYYISKAESEIKRILGNQLLKSIKSIKSEEYLKKALVRNCLQELFRTLSKLTENSQAKLDLKIFRGELSKQAKIEYAIKKANASTIDWENEL